MLELFCCYTPTNPSYNFRKSFLYMYGDHAENIVELGEFRMTNKLDLSADAAELKEMMEVANHAVNKALVALEHKDKEAAKEVLQFESKLDELEVQVFCMDSGSFEVQQ